MNANCDDCMRGPSMIDGHPGLIVRSLGKEGMMFTCRHCDLAWSRSYSTTGQYEWTRQAERVAATACVGVVLPATRPEPAAVVAAAGIGGGALDQWLAIQRGWKPRRDPQ